MKSTTNSVYNRLYQQAYTRTKSKDNLNSTQNLKKSNILSDLNSKSPNRSFTHQSNSKTRTTKKGPKSRTNLVNKLLQEQILTKNTINPSPSAILIPTVPIGVNVEKATEKNLELNTLEMVPNSERGFEQKVIEVEVNVLSSARVEERLLKIGELYQQKRKNIQYMSRSQMREKSQFRIDGTNQSQEILEQKKLKIFNELFEKLKLKKKHKHIEPNNANLRKVSIQLIDALMDVFMDFEEEQKPWSLEYFIEKCQNAFKKMTPIQRNDLFKQFQNQRKEKVEKPKYHNVFSQHLTILVQK